MRRLYCPHLATGRVTVIGPEAHHGRNVLRLRVGELIELFDGQGRSAEATVEAVDRSELHFQVRQTVLSPPVRPRITLATAIPKFAHQEVLVRMGTELGVSVFQPMVCERSSVREQFRADKWRRWAIEAGKQCGTHYLPEVRPVMRFDAVQQTAGSCDLVVVGDGPGGPAGEDRQRMATAESVLLLVGPEGGFSPEEHAALETLGAMFLRVGPHVLRIETAGVALCAVIRFLS